MYNITDLNLQIASKHPVIPQSNTCIGAPILPLRCCSATTGLTEHESSGAARCEYQHKHSNMTVSCSEHYKT